MSALSFIDEFATKLEIRGMNNSWQIDRLAQKLVDMVHAPDQATPVAWDGMDMSPIPDSHMIHEMLRRGFAVMRIKENGASAVLEPVDGGKS